MILINEHSKQQLEAVFNNLPHCILLSGARGIGLKIIARKYSRNIDKVPYEMTNDSEPVSIDDIRSLQKYTSKKQINKRLVIISNVEKLSHQAQNALLKLLEEPISNIHFILLSNSPSLILNTVRSRSQEVVIKKISPDQSSALLDYLKIKDTNLRKQLLFLADGLPGELTKLAQDKQYFDNISESVKDAKDFLSSGAYDKCILIQKIYVKRENVLIFIEHCLLLVKYNLIHNPKENSAILLDKLLEVYQRIQQNGNTKAQLLTLV